MDALFFLSMACLNAVMAVIFFKYGRSGLAVGEKNEESIRDTFSHCVLTLGIFLVNSAVYYVNDIELSGDSACISTTGMLLLVDWIPLIYMKSVRYSCVPLCNSRWMMIISLALIISTLSISHTGISHLASCILDFFFLVFNVILFCVAILTQCRLCCRFGKENMSAYLFRTAGVLFMLFLSIILFSICRLMDDLGRCGAVLCGCAAMTIYVLHSVEVLLGYPLLCWLEKKCRRDVKQSDSDEFRPEVLMASELLAHRLKDYFEVEKPYLSPELCITEVALYLMTNKTTLSRVIHLKMKTNFREFVNRYRVREAMDLYSRNMHLDMEQLARRSGFRNNTSFTNAFKLNLGMTPGAWCKEQKEKRNEIWERESVQNPHINAEQREKKQAEG